MVRYRGSTDGPAAAAIEEHSRDAASLCDKLEQVIAPLFYKNRDGFVDVMRYAIALNGSFFNTHRMLQQYVLKRIYESRALFAR